MSSSMIKRTTTPGNDSLCRIVCCSPHIARRGVWPVNQPDSVRLMATMRYTDEETKTSVAGDPQATHQ